MQPANEKQALRTLRDKSLPVSKALRAKAAEAEQWQAKKAADSEALSDTAAANVIWALMLGSAFAVALAIVGGVALRRTIATPLERAVVHLAEVAQGNLSRDAPSEFLARGDEIGMLARAKQAMITNLRQMVQEIGGGIQVLSSSSAQLSANSIRCRMDRSSPPIKPTPWPPRRSR